MKRSPNEDVTRRMGEKITLIGTIVENESSMLSHLLRHYSWFTILIEGVKKGKGFVVNKRL